MRKLVLILVLLSFGLSGFATHIAGGELFYEYLGSGTAANSSRYRVTLRLFRACNSVGQVLTGESPSVGIYNRSNNSLFSTITLTLQGGVNSISYTPGSNPCIQGAQDVCYQVGVFTGTVELPESVSGYTFSWIRYTRIGGIINAQTDDTGATFIATVPGTNILGTGVNSSPQFRIKDTALVCRNNEFKIDFSATDIDGDSLAYRFGVAYDGSTGSNPPNPPPPATLVLPGLTYISPYTSTRPLGNQANIDKVTGLVSGKAPSNPGKYVVCVEAEEWRNGVLINIHRKDFIMEVKECDIPAPVSNFNPVTCDGFTFKFPNESTGNIMSYYWDFGTGNTADVSTDEFPSFTFPDTGIYKIKLVINRGGQCSDSITKNLGVYPGFFAGFTVSGSCFQTPFQFTDTTKTRYGAVDTWRWNFGDNAVNSDTSRNQNPTYNYPAPGTYNTEFIVSNSKGCKDTVTKVVTVLDKPALTVDFNDTLICSIDTLRLIARGDGNFTWTPNYNIINRTTATPLVYPKNSTTYTVNLNKDGCVNSETVRVNVVDPQGVYVNLGADTVLCITDTIILQPNTNALNFIWSPNVDIDNINIKNPKVYPDNDITYTVRASVGKCPAVDNISIRTAPYPQAFAGNDTSICYGDMAQLNGSVTSISYNWSPINTLNSSNTLSPLASPLETTNYILTATGLNVCPKSKSDTVLVTVIPPVPAFAGNDTTVVITQPLQFNASGGTQYLWTPGTYLSNRNINNPVGVYNANLDSIRYVLRVQTDEGCTGYDSILVRIFKTVPSIFIPTGFTPNNDGLNDVLKPILAGMSKFNYFRVYNRWGEMMYSTSKEGEGWNGLYKGVKQPSGTYVYMAEAVDYTGKRVFVKNTVVLIR